MILKREDFPSIAFSLALLLSAVSASFALPFISQRFLQRMVLEEARSEKALLDANEKIREAARERESISIFKAAYGRLVTRGVIGNFERLDLVEHLDEAGSSVFSMQYSVSPQEKIPEPGFYSIDVNRATVNLDVLHEGKLLDFLDALEAKSRGLFLVEGCAMERIEGESAISFAPHLKAGCSLMWVTLEAVK